MILLIGTLLCAFIVLLGHSKKEGKPMLDKESSLYIWAVFGTIAGIIAFIISWISALIG